MAYLDTNAMPRRSDGTVLHLGVKAGQVANRVVSVGSLERAKLLAQLLDDAQFETIESARGFKTFTGKMKGVQVSIVATGMGVPNMDFVVRNEGDRGGPDEHHSVRDLWGCAGGGSSR